jgi:hypothetical protein
LKLSEHRLPCLFYIHNCSLIENCMRYVELTRCGWSGSVNFIHVLINF